jgi:hypothetical protein
MVDLLLTVEKQFLYNYFNAEVKCTESSPSVKVPCSKFLKLPFTIKQLQTIFNNNKLARI